MSEQNKTGIDKQRLAILGFIVIGVAILLLATTTNSDEPVVQDSATSTEAIPKKEEKPKPIKLNGTTETATQPFKLREGPARFEISYSGNEYFSATLLDSDGNEIGLLANQANKPYQGSTLEHIDYEDNYEINIEDEDAAPWSITITQENQ